MSERPQSQRKAIQNFFAEVATRPGPDLAFHSGRLLAQALEYPPAIIEALPDAAIESFVGVGNPFQLGPVSPGESVLDIGCGSGFDCIVAAHLVGPNGRVVGVDLTPEMVRKADRVARELDLRHIAFLEGDAQALPIRPNSVDLAISNGAILFCPDKPLAFAEAYRTLKPGGRLYLADVLIPDVMALDLEALTLLDRGFQLESEYLALLAGAGFVKVELASHFDVTGGALGGLDTPDVGVMGACIRARKPDH